jgi:GNAT superfamily N-acetyltransferase
MKVEMDALPLATIATVDRYWLDYFACSPTAFEQAITLVVPHAGLADYHGIFYWRRRDTLIISVPPAEYVLYRAHFASLTSADFDDVAALTRQSPPAISHVIGPAWIGYAAVETFRPDQHGSARLLTSADEPALLRFRAACPTVDWEHGGSTFGTHPLAGQFIGDALVALAGYELWGEHIAHISVVTLPAYRGQRYGAAVVSVLAETALSQRLIPQYRTLHANTPSIRLAAALGFVAYAESIAFRFA